MKGLIFGILQYFSISMECSTGTYTRSRPTYDEQSLYDDDDDDDDDRKYGRHPPPQAAAAAWNFQPQASRPPPPSSGLNMGRGRGRGRGLQSSQPLRRPNFLAWQEVPLLLLLPVKVRQQQACSVTIEVVEASPVPA